MLRVGRASSVSCKWVCCLETILCAGHASSLSCNIVTIWWLYLVNNICMLYNFCYVMTTLCILYCDVTFCRDLMSKWKWLRFCVAGNHISFCLTFCLFLCVGILLCVCVCVCVYVHACMLMCVRIRLYLSLCVYMQAFSVKQINPCPTKWLGNCSHTLSL